MLSELHSLELKLYRKQYNKNFGLHLIVVPQLSSGWQHNYSTKKRQTGRQWALYVFSYVYGATLPIIIIKFDNQLTHQGPNKLECLSLATLSSRI